MDSLPLAPTGALKLVEVYQLVHDINQIQREPLLLQWQNDLMSGQILEQKVVIIFQATSIALFQKGLKDLVDFIDERLAKKPLKYPDLETHLTEKLLGLKNILIQIQDQSTTPNV